MTPPSKSPYYKEVDGLRALSVLLILLFHLQFPALGGGFVGVDVFFVISGYLITNIVLGELGAGRFSFARFYLRRIARILPALVVVIAISVLAASVIYTPPVLQHALKQGLYALLSVSNIFFWADASYWSPTAKQYLLLHTWSLGVEEQFYLFYPVLLFACYRLGGRRATAGLLLALVVLGFALAQYYLPRDPAAVFFLTPFRLSEFALGGLGSLLAARYAAHREAAALLPTVGTAGGLGLILYAAFNFNGFTPFPGINALYPTLGALLVILCAQCALGRWLLGNSPMVWIGRLSYALYLVHWPLIVLYRYLFGAHLDLRDQATLAAASLLLAYALNRWVESRFRLGADEGRTQAGHSARRVYAGLAAAMLAISLFIWQGVETKGWPGRIPEEVRGIATNNLRIPRGMRNDVDNFCAREKHGVFCGRRDPDKNNIILLADSRVFDILPALHTAYPDYNVYTSHGLGCAPLLDRGMSKSQFLESCPQLNERRMTAALQAPASDIVFLAMDFLPWRGPAIVETVAALVDSGKRVYVLGQTQFLDGKAPREIATDQVRWRLDADYIERFVARQPFAMDERYGSEIERLGGVYISNRGFFNDGHYRLFTRDRRNLLSYDGKHLTRAGAAEFGSYLAAHYPLEPDLAAR